MSTFKGCREGGFGFTNLLTVGGEGGSTKVKMLTVGEDGSFKAK